MTEEDFGGVKVDVCEKCGGIWFDWMELRSLDEKKEGHGPALEKALKAEFSNEPRGTIKCPKCGMELKKHSYRFNKDVEIDECYSCGGIFLDSGELKLIREGFMNEKRRKEFVDSLLSKIPEYNEEKKKSEQRKKAVNNLTEIIDKINIKLF